MHSDVIAATDAGVKLPEVFTLQLEDAKYLYIHDHYLVRMLGIKSKSSNSDYDGFFMKEASLTLGSTGLDQ